MAEAQVPGRPSTTASKTPTKKGFQEPPLPTLPPEVQLRDEQTPDRVTQALGLITATLSGKMGADENLLAFLRQQEAQIREGRLRRDLQRTNIQMQTRAEALRAREAATGREFTTAMEEDRQEFTTGEREAGQNFETMTRLRTNLDNVRAANDRFNRELTLQDRAAAEGTLARAQQNRHESIMQARALLSAEEEAELTRAHASNERFLDREFTRVENDLGRKFTTEERKAAERFRALYLLQDHKLQMDRMGMQQSHELTMQGNTFKFNERAQVRGIEAQKDLQQGSQKFQGKENAKDRAQREKLQQEDFGFKKEMWEVESNYRRRLAEIDATTQQALAEVQSMNDYITEQAKRDQYETTAISHANGQLFKLYDELETKQKIPASVLLDIPGGADMMMMMITTQEAAGGKVSQARLESALNPIMAAFANSRDQAIQGLRRDEVKKLYSTVAARVKQLAEAVPENRREAWIQGALDGIQAQQPPENFMPEPTTEFEPLGPTQDDRQGAVDMETDAKAITTGVMAIVDGWQKGVGMSPGGSRQMAALFEKYKGEPQLVAYADTMYAMAAEKIAEQTGQDIEMVTQMLSDSLKEAIDSGRDQFFFRNSVVG